MISIPTSLLCCWRDSALLLTSSIIFSCSLVAPNTQRLHQPVPLSVVGIIEIGTCRSSTADSFSNCFLVFLHVYFYVF